VRLLREHRSEADHDGRRLRRSVLAGVYVATLAVGTIAVSSSSWAEPPAAISLDKTVGTDASVCAKTDVITVPAGSMVVFCYKVTNNSLITFSVHDLVDDELGHLLNPGSYVLTPGNSHIFTTTAFPTATVTNTATWTATPGIIYTSTVLPEVITSTVTLTGTATDTATVDAGTKVTYCYMVTNNYQDTTFSIHDLTDSELGSLLSGFSYGLLPGSSVFITQSATITDTITNSATWTARIANGVPNGRLPENEVSVSVQAVDSALVEVTTTTSSTTTTTSSTTTTSTVPATTVPATTAPPVATTTPQTTTTTTVAGVLPATGGGGSGMTMSLLLIATGGALLALGRRKRLAD
jgi:hypothetical protein